MAVLIDITGQRFGRLVAVRQSPSRGGRRRWVCQCDCGKQADVSGYHLRSALVKSCGCLRRPHGQSHCREGKAARLYVCWCRMRSRCRAQTDQSYERYGARGIAVCAGWEDFRVFERWALANGYDDRLSIDRVDNDGDYTPSNCRWATAKQQARNRRSNITVAYQGKTATLAEHAEDLGFSYKRARVRISDLGWSPEKAIETPIRPWRDSHD